MSTLRRILSHGGFVRRVRMIHLAPVLATVTLAAWAFASPVGAAPDDDYHLVSTWCAMGGSEACEPGSSDSNRTVSVAFDSAVCYAQIATASAACQDELGLALDGPQHETERGNFQHEYPGVYYGAMHVFAGDSLERSALVMRIFNVALFVGLTTAAYALLHPSRRQTLVWGWLVSVVPLGMFLIASNNPSGWAVTGVGTAFISLLGYFEADGKRRWALGSLYLIGVVMAAGARGDAAVYAAGATLVVGLLTASWRRDWLLRAILPLGGLILIVLLFVSSTQAGVGLDGFSGGGPAVGAVGLHEGEGAASQGIGLAAYNLLMLPLLWTGVWGTWALGWFDTELAAIVPWSAASAFIVVGFAGLRVLTRRKLLAVMGVFMVLIVLPVYVLTVGHDRVGSQLQPRYLLPLIVVFALVLMTAPGRGSPTAFTRVQTMVIFGALALANMVALRTNVYRYVTGVNGGEVKSGDDAAWWWNGAPVGPAVVWLVGSAAFVGLLAVLWAPLRRPVTAG